MQVVHKHLLAKAEVKSAPKNYRTLNDWLTRLVASIDMKICIEPRSIYVDEPGNKGLTGQVGIETSHIAIHIWDECSPAVVQMDVYSCKEFDESIIPKFLDEWGLVNYESLLIDRSGKGFSILEVTH